MTGTVPSLSTARTSSGDIGTGGARADRARSTRCRRSPISARKRASGSWCTMRRSTLARVEPIWRRLRSSPLVVVVQRAVECDHDAAVLELTFDECSHPLELVEAEVELDVHDLGRRQPQRLLQLVELGLPAVLPGSDHPGFCQRVERFVPTSAKISNSTESPAWATMYRVFSAMPQREFHVETIATRGGARLAASRSAMNSVQRRPRPPTRTGCR